MAARHHTDGYAAPLIYIYQQNGKLITDRNGRSIGHECISFEYTYDEESDEECNIVIQTADKFLPDNPLLQVKRNLVVQWGYNTVGGDKILSPKRLVTIRDVETKYEAKSIKYKIKCTDFVALLKEVKVNGIMQDHFVNWLSEIVGDQYTATIHINSEQNIQYNNASPTVIEETGLGRFGNVVVARENAKAPTTIDVFGETRIYKGESRAIHAAIEDKIKFAGGGPYFIDGRDNNLNIRSRNYNQNPNWKFEYNEGRGDVIDFSPKTTYKKSQLEDTENNLTDGLKKQIIKLSAAYIEEEDVIFGKQEEGFTTASGQKITGEQLDDYINNTLKPLFEERVKSGNIDYVKDKGGNILNSPGAVEALQHAPNFKLDLINHKVVGGGTPAGVISQSDIDANNVQSRSAIDNATAHLDLFEEVHLDIPPKEILALPEVAEYLENLNDNVVKERKQRKVEAKLTVIGDPQFQTSKTLTLSGYAKVHNGLWYTTRVEHKLSPGNGYVIVADVIKKPTPGNKVSAKRTSKLKSKVDSLITQAQDATKDVINKSILTEEEFSSIVKPYNDARAKGNDSAPVTGDENTASPSTGNTSTNTSSPSVPAVSGDNDAPATTNQTNEANSSNTTPSANPNTENN